MSWNQKVGETAKGSANENVAENTTLVEKEDEQNGSLTFDELKQAVVNLPEAVQQYFKEAYVKKEQVNIAFVGSSSLGSNENGWSVIAKKELENFYGKDLVNISIYEFEGTSTEFLNSEWPEQIIEENPNIVLLESFRLEDNHGFVSVDVAQENLITFMEQLREEIPEVEFIIQLPNPLSSAVNYPLEVEEMKQFIDAEGIPYFNHWENWPTENSEEMKELLSDGLPNEQGHLLWADAVINYFIAQQ